MGGHAGRRRPLGVALWGSVGGRCRSSRLYGVLYGSASDSRWHECGHGTAFKTPWMNDLVYQVASFMIMREPEVTRAGAMPAITPIR